MDLSDCPPPDFPNCQILSKYRSLKSLRDAFWQFWFKFTQVFVNLEVFLLLEPFGTLFGWARLGLHLDKEKAFEMEGGFLQLAHFSYRRLFLQWYWVPKDDFGKRQDYSGVDVSTRQPFHAIFCMFWSLYEEYPPPRIPSSVFVKTVRFNSL